MLTIDIKVNGEPIRSHKVVNVTQKHGYGIYGVGRQLYEVDEDILIRHSFEDGADELVKLVIDTLPPNGPS